MAEQSRLEKLLDKQKELEGKITEEKAREEADKVLNGIGANVATVVQKAATDKGVDINVLSGKFFALTVEDGKLSVEVVTKARKSNGGENHTAGNGNGNGNYEYFLADGRGAYATIQLAMDALGVAKGNRPQHNRYDRLSDDWKAKIIRKDKASQPAATS
ncbi:hypothetical protein ES703_20835 [subsurface metagenome]